MVFQIDTRQSSNPRINLALEEYCLRHLPPDKAYVFFYINDPAVVIGRHQNPLLECDQFFAQCNDIVVVRRISGGGTVFHDSGNLNFCFINPFTRDSLASIEDRLAPLLESLQRLGIEPVLDDRNAIFIGDRKISGNAQFTDTRRIMVHGTLLFETNLNRLRASLKPTFDHIASGGPASIRQPVTNIADHIRAPMDIAAFQRCLLKTISEKTGGIQDYRLTDLQWNHVRQLAQNRYERWNWNFGKSPDYTVTKVASIDDQPVQAKITVKNGRIRDIDIRAKVPVRSELLQLARRLRDTRYDRRAITAVLETEPGFSPAQTVHRRELADLIY